MEDSKEIELDKKDGSNNEAKETVDEKPYHYNHSRAIIAVDMVVFGIKPEKHPDNTELCVFVHRPAGKGDWWLPGRFMHCGQSIENEKVNDGDNWTLEDTMEAALCRKWKVKKDITVNGIKVTSKETPEVEVSYTIKPNTDFLCQLEAMSALNRDDRNKRVVSIPYMTLVCVRDEIPSDICPNFAQWIPVSKLIKIKENFAHGEEALAHDHFEILKNGLKRLFQEVRTRPLGKHMLSTETSFDISHLIHIYNVILHAMGVSVERSNLRKLLTERGVIKEVNDENPSGKGGGAYRFVDDKYKEYKRYLNFGFNPKPRGDKRA